MIVLKREAAVTYIEALGRSIEYSNVVWQWEIIRAMWKRPVFSKVVEIAEGAEGLAHGGG
jgi:hypothetical protein